MNNAMDQFLQALESYRYQQREREQGSYESALSQLDQSQAQWQRDMNAATKPAAMQQPVAQPPPWQAPTANKTPTDAEAEDMYSQLAQEDAEWQRQMAELYGGR